MKTTLTPPPQDATNALLNALIAQQHAQASDHPSGLSLALTAGCAWASFVFIIGGKNKVTPIHVSAELIVAVVCCVAVASNVRQIDSGSKLRIGVLGQRFGRCDSGPFPEQQTYR